MKKADDESRRVWSSDHGGRRACALCTLSLSAFAGRGSHFSRGGTGT